MSKTTRRQFIAQSLATGTALSLGVPFAQQSAMAATKMKLGLVTYLWGQDWPLPTLLANCEKTGVMGVELRTQHAHGVDPHINAKQRAEVKAMFADSPIIHVGLGSNQNYDSPDPDVLKAKIEGTRAFLQLSHDTGGSGLKVKPNSFHKGVDRQKTIEQIGNSLNIVGKMAGDLGQKIRLEVHGQCSPLPIIKQIMDIADNPHVGVCWNSNDVDLEGDGLEHNFNLVKDRFADTVHVREFNVGKYPYEQLMGLFTKMDYDGWILLECRTKPADRIAALIEQREIFEKWTA